MPSTDVELSGMTINLIEDKQTYDAMTKNPNEMYLVEKDYDLAISIEYIWNNSTDMYDAEFEIVEGSIKSVFDRIQQDDTYCPKIKISLVNHYAYCIYNELYIVDCIVGRAPYYSEIAITLTGNGAGGYSVRSSLSYTSINFNYTHNSDTVYLYLRRSWINISGSSGTPTYKRDTDKFNYAIPYA